jgi:putative FmdB family regulatory protein
MPTYEYACLSCGRHVDVFQQFSADPLTECGVCGGPLRKVFHPAGILFKGSGFYATDSRRPSGGDRDKRKETVPSKSGGEAGSGAEGSDRSASGRAAAGSPGSGGEGSGSAGSKGEGSVPSSKERSA